MNLILLGSCALFSNSNNFPHFLKTNFKYLYLPILKILIYFQNLNHINSNSNFITIVTFQVIGAQIAGLLQRF